MEKNRFIELLTKDLAGEITVDEQRELAYLRGEPNYDRKEEELLRAFWANSHKEEYDSSILFKNIQQRITSGDEAEEEELPLALYNKVAEEPIVYTQPATAGFGWIHQAAAALLLICFTFITCHTYFAYKKELIVKETAKGVRSVFTLKDGTQVRLNSDTRLEYPANFSDSTRDVFLSGEAFFDVSKDKAHPFIIHTKDMDIKVVGTTFNVQAYENENSTEATLIHGAITVTLKDAAKKQIFLKPSQKLVLTNLRNERRRTKNAKQNATAVVRQLTYFKPDHSTVIETSWTENKLTFKNEDFSTLARSMERWYNIDINFQSETVKQLRFTGVIEKENINEALKALQLTEKFNFSMNDSTVSIF
ncbi:FecR family protein [Pedobacter sp. L105]|uniref:FecR family protein n=1 Tax=Pedobacter sp. L105 TaxID=1641871 RepID=UPI00131BAB33|nr:FecR domain-containing protein [Pedobacter sp. L105]